MSKKSLTGDCKDFETGSWMLKKIGSMLLSTLIELAGVSNKKRSFGFSNVFSLSESF